MPKPLVLALIVVAALVLVLVGAGMTRERASSDPDDHGWTQMFEFGGPPPVEVEHLQSSNCFDAAQRRLFVQQAFTCETVIGPADDTTRLLGLEPPGSPPLLIIDFGPAGSEGVEIEDWRPGDEHFPLRIPVGPGGGTLEIRCLGPAGTCPLHLQES